MRNDFKLDSSIPKNLFLAAVKTSRTTCSSTGSELIETTQKAPEIIFCWYFLIPFPDTATDEAQKASTLSLLRDLELSMTLKASGGRDRRNVQYSTPEGNLW